METPPVQPEPAQNQSWGAVIGIAIILVVLIAGGVYFFLGQKNPGQQAPAVGAGRA